MRNVRPIAIFLRLVWLFDSICGRLPRIGRFRPIRGVFSASKELKTNQIDGEIVCASQDPGPCHKHSINHKLGLHQHDHQPWPIFWTMTEDARLVGKMLQWRTPQDLLCLEGSFHTTKRRRIREDRFFAQIFPGKPINLPGAWTSIVSNWGGGENYYHWMLDCLTRLMIRDKLPEETRVLIPKNPPQFAKDTIEMLGLDKIVIQASSSCIHPERYYFCSPTAMTGTWNPLGYDWLRAQFGKFMKPQSSAKPIFMTRRGVSRAPKNIDKIEALFRSRGFRIIDCGKHTVREQIELASSATTIAGLHGAAMTNILWANSGTPVLEIFQPEYLNACFEQIANHCKLDYHYLILEEDHSLSDIQDWLNSKL